jgi:transposase-like protein
MGATQDGTKELVAVEGGYRESRESWACLLRDLRARGMCPPKLFIGDGALGFWAAAAEVFPESRNQRCRVHKTGDLHLILSLPNVSQNQSSVKECTHGEQ